MIALDKLQAAMNARLNTLSIMEPSNAMASRHIRIKPNNIKLTPLSKTSADIRYMPYACLLDIVISYRLRGGNVDNLMTTMAMNESLLLTEFLTQGTITIKGVAQNIDDLELLKNQHPDWKLMIVGDALLFDAHRVDDDFGNMSDEMDAVEDELFVYEDQWKVKMALTVHRHFPNPLLNNVVYSSDEGNEDICVER